jgi:hypothetical protein
VDRDNAIELMTEAIIKFNRDMAKQQNAPSEMVEEFIEKSTPEFKHVNGMLFDLLYANGYIK